MLKGALWRLLWPYRWRLGLAMGLQAVAGICSILPLGVLAWLAGTLEHAGPDHSIDTGALWVVLTSVALWLACHAWAAHIAHQVDADACTDVRRHLLNHLQQLPLYWFSRQGPDGVARLVEQDVRALHQLIAHAPNDLSNLLIVPWAALLCLGAWQPWLLAMGLVPLLCAAAGYALLRSAHYRADFARRNAALENLSQDYGEFSHNLLLVRQYPGAGIQGRAASSAHNFLEAFSAWVSRVGHMAALVQVQLGAPWLTAWVLMGAFGLGMFGMPVAIGPLCAFVLLLRVMAAPVQAMGHGGDALLAASEAADRLQSVFDQPPLSEGSSKLRPADSALCVRGLGFSYDRRPLLEAIDLTLTPGNLHALVGPSGSGKSTLLQLLARSMDPQTGSIQLGGIELRDLPAAIRHQHIVLLSQQACVLELSLAQNIALLQPDASLDDIRAAARAACLDERIMDLPKGYASVPARDVQLSGGEMQRLALARALLSPAPVLMLDEPTSAVDPQTSRALHQALRQGAGSRTRLVVSHQLAEVMDAQQIWVLDQGRVVERGTHSLLLQAHGLYARLWHEQQGGLA